MIPYSKGKRSQLFSLRLWAEETAEGDTEWRGKVERVTSGETLYFRQWEAMLKFLQETLEQPAPRQEPAEDGIKSVTHKQQDRR